MTNDGISSRSVKKISDKEFEAVLKLEKNRRYEHFLKQVADWGVVWSLGDENGWVMFSDDSGREVAPFWPHPKYAEACATDHFEGNKPQSIKLKDFLLKWLPGLSTDKRLVAVFPRPDGDAAVADPNQLKLDLERELQNYR
jgi:hypothetical protein